MRTKLRSPHDGSMLPGMVGAVIYVRVSTKEQTENLSLPTQLKACEERSSIASVCATSGVMRIESRGDVRCQTGVIAARCRPVAKDVHEPPLEHDAVRRHGAYRSNCSGTALI